MSLIVIGFVLFSSVCGVFGQDIEIPECSDFTPQSCVEKCACAYCTMNETIADMLLNGTMSSKELKKSGDDGFCIDDDTKCDDGYYFVLSKDVIFVDGGDCDAALWVVVLVLLFGRLIFCLSVFIFIVYGIAYSTPCLCRYCSKKSSGDYHEQL